MPVARLEDLLSALRGRGVRVTRARRAVLDALVSSGGHASAEEIAERVATESPDVYLSTVYRNLEELERLGVVVHAHLGHGPAFYHLASAAHAHLVCEVCGATIEVGEELFATLATEALAGWGFQVNPRHSAVLGRCASCR